MSTYKTLLVLSFIALYSAFVAITPNGPIGVTGDLFVLGCMVWAFREMYRGDIT